AYINNLFTAADFVSNLVLYVPLGIALSGSSLVRAFLVGLTLSISAEVLQLSYVGRIPSFIDIASCTCGAVVGYLAAMFWRRATGYNPVSLRVYRPLALAAIPIVIFGTMILLFHRPRSDFSNWSSTFHLATGNELTGDRPWAGTISEFAIYPFAMAQSQISDLNSRRSGSYSSEPPIVSLAPTGSGRPLLSKPEELRLFDTLVRTNQLTLLVSMRTSNLEQTGPARIITYSQDRTQRNFTLGQIRNSLTFRLRTPDSGPNGNDPALISGPVLSLNRTFFVAEVYDGRFSKLYVDGKCVGQVDLGAKRPRLPKRISAWLPGSLPIREMELGGAQILFSGLLSLGILALVGIPRRLSTRLFAGAMAGAAIGGTTWVFGVTQPSLGIRILLECVAAGLVIVASVEADTAGPPAPGSSLLSRLDLRVKARLRQ
ncbi:MAG: VanZ family protein, partial [Edaphobacter sp.]|nr:VanZ family protein [Edaphobacter sp.]